MPYYMSGADSAPGGRSAAESDEGTLAAKYGFWKLYLMSCVAEVLMILAILLFLIPIIMDEPLLYLIPAPFVPCIFLVLIPPAERAKMNRELGCGQTRGSFIENIKFYLLSTVGLIVVVGVPALCFGGLLALLLYLIRD